MTLTFKIVNQFFCKTHCLMITYHHTKFGKKWLRGSEDTEQTWSDTQTDVQTASWTDKVIPIYTPHPYPFTPVFIWGGGIISLKENSSALFVSTRTKLMLYSVAWNNTCTQKRKKKKMMMITNTSLIHIQNKKIVPSFSTLSCEPENGSLYTAVVQTLKSTGLDFIDL